MTVSHFPYENVTTVRRLSHRNIHVALSFEYTYPTSVKTCHTFPIYNMQRVPYICYRDIKAVSHFPFKFLLTLQHLSCTYIRIIPSLFRRDLNTFSKNTSGQGHIIPTEKPSQHHALTDTSMQCQYYRIVSRSLYRYTRTTTSFKWIQLDSAILYLYVHPNSATSFL